MAEQEGVIKFQLEFTEAPPLSEDLLRKLSAWRRILYRLELIGQTPDRYDGYGFGNISLRLPHPSSRESFVITGTQTGLHETLASEHYAVVERCLPEENRIVGRGPIRPSSESLTHGILYTLDPSIACVMHVHSPDLWNAAQRLEIASTSKDVPYGTPAMAKEVQRIFCESAVQKDRIFSMGGHEDGIVSFGRSVEEAGIPLVSFLAKALEIS